MITAQYTSKHLLHITVCGFVHRVVQNGEEISHLRSLLYEPLEVQCAAPEPQFTKLHVCRSLLIIWQGGIGNAL
jgi:hypothetical protein